MNIEAVEGFVEILEAPAGESAGETTGPQVAERADRTAQAPADKTQPKTRAADRNAAATENSKRQNAGTRSARVSCPKEKRKQGIYL